jgi:anaerobic magnesium-protoporphyrin IX monomethyl ester cyclase
MARVAFIAKIATNEPLGVMRLGAGLIRQGHEAILVDPWEPGAARRLLDFRPQLLGFTVMTGQQVQLRRIARVLRSRLGCPVIFGGPHATFYPQEIEHQGIDAICRGEGDEVILEIAEALDGGARRIPELPGLWVEREDGSIAKGQMRRLIPDLDALPFPDRDMVYRANALHRVRGYRGIMASRGCYNDCAYCHNHIAKELYRGKGAYLRYRSVDNVIEELRQLTSRRSPATSFIHFQDDTLLVDPAWFERLAASYQRHIRLPYMAFVTPDRVSEDSARLLGSSGCRVVLLGIDSGNERVRRELLERPYSDHEIVTACDRLHRNGIRIVAGNLLGIPGATIEEELDSIRLNQRCRIDHPQGSTPQPYPGTRLAERLRLSAHFDGDFDRLSEAFFTPAIEHLPQLQDHPSLQTLFHLFVVARVPVPAARRLAKLPPNPTLDWLAAAVKLLTWQRTFAQPMTPRNVWSLYRTALRTNEAGKLPKLGRARDRRSPLERELDRIGP